MKTALSIASVITFTVNWYKPFPLSIPNMPWLLLYKALVRTELLITGDSGERETMYCVCV